MTRRIENATTLESVRLSDTVNTFEKPTRGYRENREMKMRRTTRDRPITINISGLRRTAGVGSGTHSVPPLTFALAFRTKRYREIGCGTF